MMKNRAYTLIELLSVVVILAIISAIAVPRVLETIGISKITAYNVAKENIVSSAKIKYLADVNNSKITQYTVDDLIKDGYLKKDIKNPITNQKYENTKILITNGNGNIKYNYVEGSTLYDIISSLNDKDGVYKQNDTYIYKGNNVNNYLSYDGKIYRILKIDEYRKIYLLLDDVSEKISDTDVIGYINSYYNDNYLENSKNNIVSVDMLKYNDYMNSYIDDETYINVDDDIWLKDSKDYKVLSYLTNQLTDKKSARAKLVVKMKNSLIVKDGNGTQLNPYIIEK